MKPFIVAIDGPAAAGKGTIGKNLARHFDWPFLDTGLLYRAIAKNLVKGKLFGNPENAIMVAEKLQFDDLKQYGLRAPNISRVASEVAAIPGVRMALIDFQRNFANHRKGAVLDGRDIGTVIWPDADIKFYITASQEVRARRRYQELFGQGEVVTFEEVFETLVARDLRDSSRQNAPLTKPRDAILIDTSDLTIKQSSERVIAEVELRFGDN